MSRVSAVYRGAEREVSQCFGREVRAARQAKGWTHSRLAQEASLTAGTLSRIERGLSDPHLSTIARLSLALGAPLANTWAREGTQ